VITPPTRETRAAEELFERALGLVALGATAEVPDLPPGLLQRPRLLALLRDTRDARVVTVVAPPGYGKTTLLTQWASEDDRPFAWVSVSKRDNDGTVLLASLSMALSSLTPHDEPAPVGPSSSGATLSNAVMSRLGEVVKGLSGPFVLVLDDVHLLHREETFSLLMALAERVPRGSQLVLAGRSDPPLPFARLCASRRLARIGTDSLRMTSREGMQLLQAEGVEITPEVADALVRQAEGWPAGLYFAALALREQPDPEQAAKRFAGDDPVIADYLREEVLRSLPDDQRDFLLSTSVLDRLSGSLCDAVLDGSRSAGLLDELGRGVMEL
jgi:LuxR family maltose regulon positive regulatory protein